MRKNKYIPKILTVIGILLFLLAACGGDNTANNNAALPENNANNTEANANNNENTSEPDEPAEPELFGDALRGGLLYDKWWKPLGLDEPTEDHPLWVSQTTNERSGKDTWRCKECHGWDYKGAEGAYASGSHFTGFAGVFSLSGGSPNEVLEMMKGSTNSDHDFSTVMDEQALIDLALFITQETIDYSAFIGDDKASASSDLTTGEKLFSSTCTDCHGPEGLAINFKSTVPGEYLPGLGNGNPWETVHKMRFGQPGVSDMPSAIDQGWTVDEQAAVLAFIQTLPETNPTSQGGVIYDKWWKALGLDEPTEDHPLWATQSNNERSGKDTWRCKECHGWDYQGVDGAYGGGSHMTGFTGVFGAQGYSDEEIIAWMDGTNNADHDFSPFFDDSAMEMMVAFLQDGTVDMTFIVDKAVVGGDAVQGEALYGLGCARCHGEDGTDLNFGSDDDPTYLGGLSWDNPWETFHKANNGQPGEHMTVGRDMGWTIEDITNIVAFLQSLDE